MRVAVLTTYSLPHACLVREIATRFDVVAVLLERREPSSALGLFVRDSRRHGPIYAFDKALFVLYRQLVLSKRRQLAERELYEGSGIGVPDDCVLAVRSVNSPEAHRRLEEARPDVLVVAGTTILRPSTIRLAPAALNIHAGILPFYRGIDTVSAALRRGDQDRIGVTIHSVVSRVDSGDVHAQSVVLIEPADDLERLETRVFRRGIDLMQETLASYRETGTLQVLRSAAPATSDTLFFGRTLRQHAQAALRLRLAASGAGRPL